MNNLLFLLLLVLLPGVIGAADTNSLEAWIDVAIEKNPELATARREWEIAQQKIPQARALEDPMFGLDVERMGTTRFDKYSTIEYMASQKVPWFGKRGAKEAVAKLDAEATGLNYLEQLRNTKAKVINAYWNLWLARKTAGLTAENRTLMDQFERIARARYETGKGMQADLLRAQVELAKMGNELITMEREVPVALYALNSLLNADPETPRPADQAIFIPPLTITLEQMQEQARQYCCVLLGFMRRVEARKLGIRVAKLESAPDFELRVEARQIEGQSGIREYDTGVFINIPWLWRGKYRAMVREAQAEKGMADAELQAEINMTLLEVKEIHTRADASQRLMALYEEKLLPQARQLVEATRAAYETGNASFLELVEAQRAWRDAQLEHYRAMAEHGRSRADLDAIIAPWGPHEFASGLVTPDMQ